MGLLKIRDENGVVRTLASIKGDKGDDGVGVPEGGTTGQVIKRTENGAEWADVSEIPNGGTTGQVIKKTDDGVGWADALQMDTTILINSDQDVKSVTITKRGLYEVVADGSNISGIVTVLVSVSDLTETIDIKKILGYQLIKRTSGEYALLENTLDVIHENGTIRVESHEEMYIESGDVIGTMVDDYYLSKVKLILPYD